MNVKAWWPDSWVGHEDLVDCRSWPLFICHISVHQIKAVKKHGCRCHCRLTICSIWRHMHFMHFFLMIYTLRNKLTRWRHCTEWVDQSWRGWGGTLLRLIGCVCQPTWRTGICPSYTRQWLPTSSSSSSSLSLPQLSPASSFGSTVFHRKSSVNSMWHSLHSLLNQINIKSAVDS